MVPPQLFTEDEINEHLSLLDGWIVSIETLPCESSRKGVSERFVRDCKILKDDLNAKDTPSAADLVDYSDRRASLEVQYHNITSDMQ